VYSSISLEHTITGLENEKQFLNESLQKANSNLQETKKKLQETWLESAQSCKLTKQVEDLLKELREVTDLRDCLEKKVRVALLTLFCLFAQS